MKMLRAASSLTLLLLLQLVVAKFGTGSALAQNSSDAKSDPTCVLFQNVALDPPTTYSVVLGTHDAGATDVSIDAYTLDTTYTYHIRTSWFAQGDPSIKEPMRISSPIELFDPAQKPLLFFTVREGGERTLCVTYILANDWDTKAWRPSSVVPQGAYVPNLTKVEGAPKCADPFAPVRLVQKATPALPTSAGSPPRQWRISVQVTVDATGVVTAADVLRTDAPEDITNAVVAAARASKYAPQLSRCDAIPGGYIFRLQG